MLQRTEVTEIKKHNRIIIYRGTGTWAQAWKTSFAFFSVVLGTGTGLVFEAKFWCNHDW